MREKQKQEPRVKPLIHAGAHTCPHIYLVEGVKAPLTFLLENDSGLFGKLTKKKCHIRLVLKHFSKKRFA